MATATFSGARAIFMVGGKVIAFASGVDGSEEIVYEPVDVLNNLYPKEFVPVQIRTSLSAAIFRTIGDGQYVGSLKKLGIFPKEKSPPSATGGPDHEVFELADDNEAIVIDRITRKTVAKFQGVKAASYNFAITARGIVGQNVTFVVISMKDESQIT